MSNPPANWYPDPTVAGQRRYWDGQKWTEHVAPAEQPGGPAAATSSKRQLPAAPQEAAASVADNDPKGSKVPLFGARSLAKQQADELTQLKGELARLGVLDMAELARERDQLTERVAAQRAHLAEERQRLEAELAELRQRVVVTQEEEILQEIGVYRYRHPLQDSVAYKDALARLQSQTKAMAQRSGGAITATTNWQVNGSSAQGRKMVGDFSKLMLRAYNAEADNLVRGMRPYKLSTAIDRLDKVAFTIERLGKTMDIRVAPEYHRLRVREMELTADYREMLAREKDREREERDRLREERKAQQDLARERERLDKERQHYLNALAALEAKGDTEAAERIRAQLQDVDKALQDVDYRAANARAGYVYVISNLGSFGEDMIKVGMTRRLEPLDRIRELSDASVPFNFDIHALFFADDAVGIEAQMHQRLADKRVNRVNLRREFFYATPAEALEHLKSLTGEVISYTELPDAVEYRQSRPSQPPDGTHERPLADD